MHVLCGRAVERVADDPGVDDGDVDAAVAAVDVGVDLGVVDIGGLGGTPLRLTFACRGRRRPDRGTAAVRAVVRATAGTAVSSSLVAVWVRCWSRGRLVAAAGGDSDVAAAGDVAAIGLLVHRHVTRGDSTVGESAAAESPAIDSCRTGGGGGGGGGPPGAADVDHAGVDLGLS